jgi:hypothetical protein
MAHSYDAVINAVGYRRGLRKLKVRDASWIIMKMEKKPFANSAGQRKGGRVGRVWV